MHDLHNLYQSHERVEHRYSKSLLMTQQNLTYSDQDTIARLRMQRHASKRSLLIIALFTNWKSLQRLSENERHIVLIIDTSYAQTSPKPL